MEKGGHCFSLEAIGAIADSSCCHQSFNVKTVSQTVEQPCVHSDTVKVELSLDSSTFTVSFLSTWLPSTLWKETISELFSVPECSAPLQDPSTTTECKKTQHNGSAFLAPMSPPVTSSNSCFALIFIEVCGHRYHRLFHFGFFLLLNST